MTVSSNVIMIVIGIHLGLFSVALCLTGNNTCNDNTLRCVYLFIYLFYLFIYLFTYLFIYLFIHLFIYLFIHLFIYLFLIWCQFFNC